MTSIARVAQLALVAALGLPVSCTERSLSEPPVDTGTFVPPPTKPQRTQAEWDFWPWDAVRFTGPATMGALMKPDTIPGRVLVSLTARPTASDSVRLEYGGCSFGVRLYRDSALTNPPVWDNRLPPNAGCFAVLIFESVRAASPLSLRIGAVNTSTLSDSLSAGRYWAAITLKMDGSVRLIPAGTVDISPP